MTERSIPGEGESTAQAIPSGRRRLGWAALGLAVLVLGIAVASQVLVPRRWRLQSTTGGECVVAAGWSREKLWDACGEPHGGGWQPKVGDASGPQFTLCSAPCEVYGWQIVLYDCKGGVSTVAQREGWHGCHYQMRDEGWEPEKPRD